MNRCANLSLRQCPLLLNKHPRGRTVSAAIRRNFSSASVSETSTSSNDQMDLNPSKAHPPITNEIKIPVRIERGPTDVLKALANTISRDYTAPHYKYHDDPYLIPLSNVAKRSYALSKESGRKAAKWVVEQQPHLFYDKNAEPAIMAYLPSPTLENASELNEETILSLIHLGLLTEAVKGYEILRQKDIVVSHEVKQSLLEMLAFYNEEQPTDEELTDERWFQQGTNFRQLKNTWKSNGTAERIFSEMESPDGRAYSALICGRAKFNSTEKAFALYEEALTKGLRLNVETFNSLLGIINFVRENPDMRSSLLMEVLTEMNKQEVQPNIGTLNSCLETVSFIGNPRVARDLSLQIVAEFYRLGIAPSLGTYYYLLSSFCKDRGPPSTILVDILNEIEGKEFTIQHPKDAYFFITAMEICRNHLKDLKIADRVHQLLLTGKNYDLIGDGFRESVYYRTFMFIRINLEPIEQFFEFYDKIVPNVYTPEPAVMEEILKSVQLNGVISYIPQLWSDMVIFDHVRRENLMSLLLQIMAEEYPPRDTESSAKLGDELSQIAWKVFTLLESQDPERTNVIYWTGKMLGDIITVFVKSGDLAKAGEIMKKLVARNQKILGVASLDSLKLFLNAFIESNDAPFCLACIQYANDAGFPEASEMAEDVFARVTLDSVQKARLNNIVGFDVSTVRLSNKETA